MQVVANLVIRQTSVKFENINAKQKQPGCKISARPIRRNNGYKRSKTLISSKAKKSNILLNSSKKIFNKMFDFLALLDTRVFGRL